MAAPTDPIIAAAAPLIVRTRGADDAPHWHPSSFAQGPFQGLQGGGVAALMCASAQAEAQARGWGRPASVMTSFLRPAPVAPLEVTIRALKEGRRASFVDADLSADGKTIACQRLCFLNAVDAPTYGPRADELPQDFATLPQRLRERPDKADWMWSAMEVRQERADRLWFRLRHPVCEGADGFAAALIAADWAHGILPPEGATDRGDIAIPNTDLIVHFVRPPHGEWIGVEPISAWHSDGVGAGWASLYDATGAFGRVSMSIAVTPLTPLASR